MGEFRDRIRGRRLLAIDDVDRLPHDDYIQQELRYTIDALRGQRRHVGRHIVDRRPASLRNLSADVRSRLAGGLELRLAPPDEAARERIVAPRVGRARPAAVGRSRPPPGRRRHRHGRRRVRGVVRATCEPVAPIGSDVRAVERYLATRAARRPTLRDILQAVAKYYRVPQKVLKSSSRRQSAVFARAMAVYLARELAGLSYERIGRALGGRDHTTIMHNYRKIDRTSRARRRNPRGRGRFAPKPAQPT